MILDTSSYLQNLVRAGCRAVLLIIFATACQKRTFHKNRELSTESTSSGAATDSQDRFLYTLVDASSPMAPHALSVSGTKQELMFQTGEFRRSSDEKNRYQSSFNPEWTLDWNASGGFTSHVGTFLSVQALSNERSKLVWECSGGGLNRPTLVGEWIRLECRSKDPSSAVSFLYIVVPPAASDNSFVGGAGGDHVTKVGSAFSATQPHSKLNLLRVGIPWREDSLRVPKVTIGETAAFEVDDELWQDGSFKVAWKTATAYWNLALGWNFFPEYPKPLPLLTYAPAKFQILINREIQSAGRLAASGLNFTDPKTGRILGLTIYLSDLTSKLPLKPGSAISSVLVHELGHTLGLGHNFAASADPLASKIAKATSVMDYANATPLDVVLPYDKSAIEYIYRNVPPVPELLVCKDIQSLWIPWCRAWDVERETADTILSKLKSYGPTLYSTFESIIVNLNPYDDYLKIVSNLNPRSKHSFLAKMPILEASYKHYWVSLRQHS